MKKQKKKHAHPLRTALIMVVMVIGTVLWFKSSKNPDIIEHSHQELEARYDYILHHVVQTNVHPLLRAVHFSIGKNFAACGTMILKKDGTEAYIVTANHLFSETQPGSDYYDYHVLGTNGFTTNGHISRVVLDSFRSSSSVESIQDIATCYPGEANLISRTSKVIVSAENPTGHTFTVNKTPPFEVISLTTGEHLQIVGEIVNTEGNVFFAMLYESVNGESGSGFWDGGNRLLILSGNITISPQTRRELGIPDKFTYITTCSSVSIQF